MKKLSVLALWALAFFLIAAPIYMNYEFHNVMMNGKTPFRATLIGGQWAVPLEDFSRAIGGNGLTLEPTLKLNGNQLTTSLEGESADHKHKGEIEVSAGQNTIGGVSVSKGVSNGIIAVRKAGGISNNVLTLNGQKFVPLADIARAFGGTFTSPRDPLKPGETLTINFANTNPNALIGFQTGGH